jgi:hypothetical protein
MANTRTDPIVVPDAPASADKQRHSDENARTAPSADDSSNEHPRLIEEHHVVGPSGEDQIEATDERGRRWYHVRPEPRSRYDFIGFNFAWWLIWIFLLFIIFAPWGRGWGY